MKMQIESTEQVILFGQFPVRIWKGVSEQGGEADVMVVALRVPEGQEPAKAFAFDAELDEIMRPNVPKAESVLPCVRDMLLTVLGSQERGGPANKDERANMLGWLAHCLGMDNLEDSKRIYARAQVARQRCRQGGCKHGEGR